MKLKLTQSSVPQSMVASLSARPKTVVRFRTCPELATVPRPQNKLTKVEKQISLLVFVVYRYT